MTQPKSKEILGMSYLEISIIIVLLCIGCVLVAIVLNVLNGRKTNTLSAKDTFQVSAISVVQDKGYTVTSAVCEFVSSELYLPSVNMDGGQIVFHAFRIIKPSLGSEVIVLFYSNHTAAQGNGLVFTVNPEATRLFPEFPDSNRLDYPITVNTSGAQSALNCAQQAGKPPSLDTGNFDVEAWRQEAIKKFGVEQVNSDGSKDDYVRTALSICRQSSSERETMLTNLGARYEGSFQQFVIETFCPYQ